MATSLTVRLRQAADFTIISGIGQEGLEAVLSRLSQQEAPVIAASKLRLIVQECLGSKEQSVPLARQLLALATYCRSVGEEPCDAVESLMAGLESSKYLEDDEKTALKSLAPVLTELLANKSVKLAAKAIDLGYDHENIYHSANFVTDIRPVFDDDRERILGAVISQTLRVHFTRSREHLDMSLAIDNEDIQALRDACDEALKKAKKAKIQAMEKMNIDVFIAGEETYGDG